MNNMNRKAETKTFWNEKTNTYEKAVVVIVDKEEVNPIYDEYISSIEYGNGEYFNVYLSDGHLVGYYEIVE